MTNRVAKTAVRPLDKKTVAIQLIVTAFIVLVAWLAWSHTQPEKLLKSDVQNGSATVFQGEVYEVASSSDFTGNAHLGGLGKSPDAKIVARPIAGGPQRVVVNEGPLFSLEYRVPGSFSTCAANRSLYYVLRPIVKGSSIGGGASSLHYLGQFAAGKSAHSQTIHASAKVVRHVWRPAAVPLLRIRRVAASGGAGTDAAKIPSDNVTIVGQHAFWIRRKSDVISTVTKGETEWTEYTSNSDLMWTDLETHSERCVRNGVSATAQLIASDSGVYWTEPHEFPDASKDLYYASATDGASVPLGTLDANAKVTCCAEWKGSVYWFVDLQQTVTNASVEAGKFVAVPLDSTSSRTVAGRLMAVDLDGKNLRTVVQLKNSYGATATGQSLYAGRKSLYAVLQYMPAAQAQTHTVFELVQVQTAPPCAIQTLQRLPPNARSFSFDQSFLYFHVPTTDRSLLATLLDEHQDDHPSDTLYRIRLPE